MYVSCIQFYVVSGNDVCRIGKAWESLVLLFAIPEVFFGIFLEGSLIDSRIGRVAAWYPHYLFLKAQATSACDMLFNFSSASIPTKHLILLFFVWKRTQLWWLFCWISLLILPDLLKKLCGQAALHGFFHWHRLVMIAVDFNGGFPYGTWRTWGGPGVGWCDMRLDGWLMLVLIVIIIVAILTMNWMK